MCGIGQECVWGEAVNVQNKYIYASQPQHNRIIVIDIGNTFNPIQVLLIHGVVMVIQRYSFKVNTGVLIENKFALMASINSKLIT